MHPPRWIFAILCGLLVSACTPSEVIEVQPRPTAPLRGGSLELGILGEPATLDPYGRSASELTFALVRPVFPMPYRMTMGGGPEPELARSLEPTPTGVRLTLERREWSTGRPITARDVVASIRRSKPPSGFARIRSAKAVGLRVVRMVGDIADWESALATWAFVLPRGRLSGGNVSGGPFMFANYERGRKLTYRANDEWPEGALLDEIEISFVQGTELLITLLQRGDLDAAWLPSSVNLGDRLDELGIRYASAEDGERIIFRFDSARISETSMRAVVAEIDMDALDEAFLRADGAILPVAAPGRTEPPSSISIAIPEGDELLALLQRAIRLDLERSGVTVELLSGPLSTLYGRWQRDPPAGALLQRSAAPDLPSASIAMASVSTFVAWREEVHGITVDPSLEGPLWNSSQWWIEPSI